ncbi:unnamed protein product, partial [Effrenium voratum]
MRCVAMGFPPRLLFVLQLAHSQLNDPWQLCINALCQSPALDVSGEPRRCSEEDRLRLNAGPNALCASEAVCRDLCAGRHDCHTAQVLTTEEVCYLKPMACERANTWYRDEFYLGFVKSGLPKGCPDIEDTAQLPREPQTTPEPAPAPAPELQPGQPGELFFHTPAPESVEEAAGPAWSATVHFHTSAPSRAPAVAISPPAPTQGGGPPASPAVAPAAWPGPAAPATPDPATAVARPAAPGAARPGNPGKAGPWPHDPPDPPEPRAPSHVLRAGSYAAMGSGGSVTAKVVKKTERTELLEIIEHLDQETLEKVHKAVAKELGVKMRRAIWTWDKPTAKEALAELGLEGKLPECTGKELVLGEAKFEEMDRARVQALLQRCGFLFLVDQAESKAPFVPPEGCRERAAYLWGRDEVEPFLKELNICFRSMEGKKLLTDSSQFQPEEYDAIKQNLGKVALLFMQDLVRERLTSPDDRWYIHIGKRCIFAGMALESPETCLRQPEREGFKGPGRPSVPSRARLMAIPVFDIDLDEDPALRWRAVAAAGAHLIRRAYAPHLRKLAEWQVAMATAPARSASRRRGRKAAVCAERRVARVAQQEALQLLQRLQGAGGFLAQLFLELRGVAEAAEVPLQALCSLSLQYE